MKHPRPNYYDIKRKIETLRQLSKERRSFDHQATLLNDILTGAIIISTTLGNSEIYRARPSEEGRLFAKAEELIYPKPEFATRGGRFNRKNQSIFYGALCQLGTIIELRPELGKFFTITRFRRTSEILPIFFAVGIKQQDRITDMFTPTAPFTQTQQLVVNFLNSEITKKAVSEDDYDLTILIAEHFMNHDIRMPDGNVVHGGIVYSSVQSLFVSNTTTRNIAMTPALYHGNYSIEETFVYVLTNEPEHYQLTPVNRATVDDDGTLVWEYTFEKMKERTSQGVQWGNVSSKAIIGTEKQL
jgi:hypothetical protein